MKEKTLLSEGNILNDSSKTWTSQDRVVCGEWELKTFFGIIEMLAGEVWQ